MIDHPQIPDGSIVITPAQVYTEVRSLTEAVHELITVDKAEKEHRVKAEERAERERDEDRKSLAAIDARVSGLERKVWLVTGAAATLGGSIGAWLPGLLKT